MGPAWTWSRFNTEYGIWHYNILEFLILYVSLFIFIVQCIELIQPGCLFKVMRNHDTRRTTFHTKHLHTYSHIWLVYRISESTTPATSMDKTIPDSKVHGANMGSTWVLSAPDGPHVDPINIALRDFNTISSIDDCWRGINSMLGI